MKATWDRSDCGLSQSIRLKIEKFRELAKVVRVEFDAEVVAYRQLSWWKRWNTAEPGTWNYYSVVSDELYILRDWLRRLEDLLEVVDTAGYHDATTITLSDEEIKLLHRTDNGLPERDVS